MEFKQLLVKRRSIRAYKKSAVLKKDLEKIIKSALLAPSWRNSETGRYYVALSDEAINVVYNCLPSFNQNSTKNAAYIVACFKKGESGAGANGVYTDNLKDKWGAYDLGLQNSYLTLQASGLGYDTLIMGLRDEKTLRKYFNIPKDEIIMPVIAIGKKVKSVKAPPRKSLKEVLHVI